MAIGGAFMAGSEQQDIWSSGFERMLVVPRALIGAAALPALAAWSAQAPHQELSVAGLLAIGALLLASSAFSASRSRRIQDRVSLRRLCWQTSAVDVVAAFGTWALLAGNAPAPGSILLPLVAFELALKNGALGASVGASLLGLGLGARIALRMAAFHMDARPGVIALVLGATGLLLGLASAIRAREIAQHSAAEERDRVRNAFRNAVNAAVEEAKRSGHSTAALEELLDTACRDPQAGREVGRQLVSLLSPPPALGSLTRREAEVLKLVAQGLGDAEIAAQLYVARVTVRVHVSNILRKLGVASREAAVALVEQWERPAPEAAAEQAPAPLLSLDSARRSRPA